MLHASTCFNLIGWSDGMEPKTISSASVGIFVGLRQELGSLAFHHSTLVKIFIRQKSGSD